MNKLCHSKKITHIIGMLALLCGLCSLQCLAQDRTNLEETPAQQLPSLPTLDSFVSARERALRDRVSEQERLLAEAELKLAQTQALEKRIFDPSSFLSISIFNSAPLDQYKLLKTEIFLDGSKSPISRGGPLNQGLPRNNEQVYFAPIAPGCHEVSVKATYVLLTNVLFDIFKLKREKTFTATQAFVVKEGNRFEIEIEGFEAQNSLFNLYRGPALRFNNFEVKNSVLSMNSVLEQGRVHIDYLTQDSSHHRLIAKNLSIDGLPILVNESHDLYKDKSVIFDAPLAQGRHKLDVNLIFAENRRIGGGPEFNMRLSFSREFMVMSGQKTLINLIGMPEGGFNRTPQNSRYARAISSIVADNNPDVFINMSCKEYEAQKSAQQEAGRE